MYILIGNEPSNQEQVQAEQLLQKEVSSAGINIMNLVTWKSLLRLLRTFCTSLH